MKIGTKLFLTYFFLIGSIFIVTSISFRFISQGYLMNETKSQLQKEARFISQILRKEELSNETVRSKLSNRKALVISERLMSSKMIISAPNQQIIYTDLKPALLKVYQNQGRLAKKRFVSETVTVLGKNGNLKGYVTLVAKLDDIQKLNSLMRRSQFVSLIISALIALFLGFIFQRNLTKPIRELALTMRNFSIKGKNKEMNLQTNDEIKELADSFNLMSRKIKTYDENQRRFFQNASHELKTPLMAIQGNAELILDRIVTGDEAEHSLNVIITESQRLKKIVEGITYLAKLENAGESFHFQKESLEQIISASLKSVQAIAEQQKIGIRVSNTVSGTLTVDAEKLTRAIINLLGNALRFAESMIEVNCFQNGRNAVIEIKDDGTGFKPGEENRIFQRFYSGDAGSNGSCGSGMGLAITKAIIEGHNGSIAAFQNKPKGAVFRIELTAG